jgi:ABC-type transporter Mla MlaB component
MATTASARLTISAGLAPRSVVVGVRGALDFGAAAGLQRVLDGIGCDCDIRTMSVDLHEVRGVDADGVTAVAAVAARADGRGAEVTLIDPPELLCLALETAGLTDLIRMVHQECQPPWPATKMDRRQAQAEHPAGQLRLLERPKLSAPLSP